MEGSIQEGPQYATMKAQVIPTSRRSVRILTINMFMRPIVNTNGTDHKEERLQAFAERYLGEFDIVCF